MKASELRVGNWLMFDNLISPSYYYQVTPRRFCQLSISSSKDDFDGDLNGFHKPIPLTEEILLKCGFKKIVFNSEEDGYGTEYTLSYGVNFNRFIITYCDDFSVGIYGEVYDMGITPNIGVVRNLHQLQNLYFALTGEELKIEL